MKILQNRLSILLLLAISSLAYAAAIWHGKVVGVSDGDTITVLDERDGKKTPVKVRLHGVDAPESKQAFGTKAKQLTSELVHGKTVEIRVVDIDRYGRTVAEVILPDGRSLNQELVRAGLAWWYQQYAPGDTALERLELEAKTARIGLWGDQAAVAPWDWRKGQRSARAVKTSTSPSPAPRVAPAPRRSTSGCCKVCRTGCACGDSCISCSKTCRKGPGCACDG